MFAVDPERCCRTKFGPADSDLGHLCVNKIVFDDDARRAYVCTNGGVTILSLPEGNIIERITVVDGLPSNHVTTAVHMEQTLYVACVGGDLAVIDMKTKLAQRFSELDGLHSFQIRQLRAEGGKVHILYDPFLLHPGSEWKLKGSIMVGQHITFKSSIFDPRTNKISAGNEILQPEALPGKEEAKELPFLGGSITVDVIHQGKRYLGGAHGLLILEDPKTKWDAVGPTVAVKEVLTRTRRWQAEARR